MTEDRQYKLLLISDFTIDNLASWLSRGENQLRITPIIPPFNQVVQLLGDDPLRIWAQNPELALVWTQPENILPSFRGVLSYEPVAEENLFREIDEFSSRLLTISRRLKYLFIPTWTLPSYPRGTGLLDMKPGNGIGYTLARCNLRLTENLQTASNIYILNTANWLTSAGPGAFSPKLWYLGKIPFSSQVFKAAAADIRAALRGLTGEIRKLIITDLDDTLWGGIVGERGWEQLILGGHDPLGEAYLDFQRGLKSLTNRGIILGIVSKNEEAVALEAIQRHPEMCLKLEDFAGWKINWGDKAENIFNLVSELNLGLDATVFIDDNPVERDRVKDILPQVLVPDWPRDPLFFRKTLLELSCFDSPILSREDGNRTKMYISERKRREVEKAFNSPEEWLRSLNLTVQEEELKGDNLPRAAQLLNKTNQMNLSTRRMSAEELSAWAGEPNQVLWTFRVSDRFGDSGLTGIASLKYEGNRGKIIDFILSCRVLGRGVEETMLHTIVTQALEWGLKEVIAEFIPTKRNLPCLEFLKRSGFKRKDEHRFTWNPRLPYPLPAWITLESAPEKLL